MKMYCYVRAEAEGVWGVKCSRKLMDTQKRKLRENTESYVVRLTDQQSAMFIHCCWSCWINSLRIHRNEKERANFGYESPKQLWRPNFIWRRYTAPKTIFGNCVCVCLGGGRWVPSKQGIFDWLTDSFVKEVCFMKLLMIQALGFKSGGSWRR